MRYEPNAATMSRPKRRGLLAGSLGLMALSAVAGGVVVSGLGTTGSPQAGTHTEQTAPKRLQVREAAYSVVQREPLDAATSNDYPSPQRDQPYSGAAQGIRDPWGGFDVRNCTSFVAFRATTRDRVPMSTLAPQARAAGGVPNLNARYWGPAFRAVGITVDSTPAVGAVAWSDPGPDAPDKPGHVAWVAQVNGDQVLVEDYNELGDGNYHSWWVTASSFTGYIHFERYAQPVQQPAPTSSSGGLTVTTDPGTGSQGSVTSVQGSNPTLQGNSGGGLQGSGGTLQGSDPGLQGGGSPGGRGSSEAGPASVTLARGEAASAGYWYAVTLTGFTPGQQVSLTCYDSVSPAGFHQRAVTVGGDGSASVDRLCYSGDGPRHWVMTGANQSSNSVDWSAAPVQPTVPAPVVEPTQAPVPTPTTPPAAPVTVAETVGGVTHTWTDPQSAGGTEGPTIATGQTVQVACRLAGFQVADGNTAWYRIASEPWNGTYYASADAFYNNGETTGGLHGTPFVDEQVPTC